MTPSLQGIFVPFVVPLDRNGDIDEQELFRYLQWLIEQGVHGFYPNGSTGEFTRFTADERRRIVQITCLAAGGRVPVLAGAAEANVRETLKACETYAEFGVRAVAIVSPFYYRMTADAVYAYFREISINSPIDVTLYNIPALASPLDLSTISKLAEFQRIIGIKDSSGDISFMQRLLLNIRPQRPDFAFLTGWEPALIAMLFVGASGGTLATAGVAPELTRAVYELATKGDFEGAKGEQARLIALFDTLFGAGEFPAGFRTGVETRGFQAGPSRQPGLELTHAQRSNVQAAVSAALA